jgi:hypothetical protein
MGRKGTRKTRSPPKPRPGLPDPRSVVSETTFVSPKGKRYRILKTTERDPYDRDPAGPQKKGR